jgi:tRNA-dihydrouridine synthase B
LAVVNEYFARAARADSRLRYETSHENDSAQDMPPASRLAA